MMKQKIVGWIVIVSTLFLVSCTNLYKEAVNLYTPGQTHRQSITLFESKIHLPPGEWQVGGRGIYRNNNGRLFFEIYLVKVSGDRMEGIVFISNRSTIGGGYYPSKYCQREDVYFKEVKNNENGKSQNCWLINHIVNRTFSGKGKAEKEFFQYIKEQTFTLPSTFIQRHHSFTSANGNYLGVEYFYNPEVSGITSSSTNWSKAPWHVLRVANNPEHLKFLEQIKKEGTDIHYQLYSGLKFKSSQDHYYK